LLAIYAPNQILHAYGFDKLPYDGTGQTIAIVNAYDNPNVASDLAAFDQAFGLLDPVLTIAQPQGKPNADLLWGLETDVDVELAHAVAPGANILLVEAKSAFANDLLAAVDYARQQPGVVAVSMSWGGPEFFFENLYDSHFTTPSGHIGGSSLPGGITFVAASGDSGGNVLWPAVSPNVLSIGGTTLSLDDSNNIANEVGWSQSGGGVSKMEAQPDFQLPFQGRGMRTTPDFSYNADVSSAYYVYDSYGFNGLVGAYGTSAGAPQWAGLIALADQALALQNIGSFDGATQTIPALYNLAVVSYGTYYNDIVDGYNGFEAGPGYDLVTGIGTPIADQVVQGLANGIAPPPAPSGSAVSKGSPIGFDPLSAVQPARLGIISPDMLVKPKGGANQTAFVLVAMANAASPMGTTTNGVLSSLTSVTSAGTAAVALLEPAQAQPTRLPENRIESGGGDNAIRADDLDDNSAVDSLAGIAKPEAAN
jgi:subtilase family serine protease